MKPEQARDLVGERVLMTVLEGYGKGRQVSEYRVLEVSPAGEWIKTIDLYGHRCWTPVAQATLAEKLQKAEQKPRQRAQGASLIGIEDRDNLPNPTWPDVWSALEAGAMRVSGCGGPNHSGCPFCRVVNRGEEYECNYFTAGRFPSRDDVGMAYKSGTRSKDCPMPERGILVRPS